MAVAIQTKLPERLSYEQYMAEGEINGRYDIVDGERIVTNPTRRHQDISGNLYELFRRYQRTSKRGRRTLPLYIIASVWMEKAMR